MVTHVFLESCALKGVGICFVGECWVALTGCGTQSHPDCVMLGNAGRGTKVVVLFRRDLVKGVRLVATSAWAVVVEVGVCRVRGVYGKCGVGVDAMEDWLGVTRHPDARRQQSVTQHPDARRQQSVTQRGVTRRGGAGLGYALGLA